MRNRTLVRLLRGDRDPVTKRKNLRDPVKQRNGSVVLIFRDTDPDISPDRKSLPRLQRHILIVTIGKNVMVRIGQRCLRDRIENPMPVSAILFRDE